MCNKTRNQLPEGGSPPRAARLRVYPLAVNEGIVFVWMGDDPWGQGAKDILPVPSTEDKLDENKVSHLGGEMAIHMLMDVPALFVLDTCWYGGEL